ncbi:MAG: M15 family metallopeptidase [Roseiflexaceae bacterium]
MSESPAIAQRPAPRSASTTRRNAAITLIVVHYDSTPDADALNAFSAPKAARSPHYYISAAGEIIQLVADDRAARHSGTATFNGRRRDIDRVSIGVVIEQESGPSRSQPAAIRRLIDLLRDRYGLLADAALVRWVPPAAGARDGSIEPFTPPEVVRRGAVLSGETAEAARSALLGIATDPATQQRFWQFLQTEAAKIRGGGFDIKSAFHLHAAKTGMGNPLGPSSPRTAWIRVGAQTFNYQHFARDTAFNEGENWGAVQNLSERLQGSLPAPGSVEFELLKSAYAAGITGSKPTTGNTNFNPGWASTQMAAEKRLGPALSGAYRITVDGNTYTVQVFGADTLYTPIANPESNTNWGDVRLLSETPAGNLSNALWVETYKPCGATYTAASPFQQAAAAAKIGTPLSGVVSANFEGNAISIQVFGLDTLYQIGSDPVKRQSALALPTQVTNWAPKPANPIPQPKPTDTPVTIPAAKIVVPDGDKNSAAWPPKPGDLNPLPSTAARQAIFGKFEFRSAPLANNPENIEVLGTWKQDNIVPVAIKQLATLAARGVAGAPKSGTILWHKLAVKQLLGMWQAWEDAGLLDRVIAYSGSYVPRFIRGSKTELSNHAFGTAFDINVAWNGLNAQPALVGQKGCVRELVPIANAFGFYWGGHFDRLDGMHFEVAKVIG